MAVEKPEKEQWKQLVEAALRIRQMAPWEWMTETDIFGVRDPASGDIGFVSTMGYLGEHLGISLYLGIPALAAMMDLHFLPPRTLQEYPEKLVEIPQLQVSFEDRNILGDWDRKLLRNLGVKVRGRQAWPFFQSFRPGFMPWRPETDEIRVLTTAPEQLEDVAPRVLIDRSLLAFDGTGRCLVRAQGKNNEWEDLNETIPPPGPQQFLLQFDAADLDRLHRVPRGSDILEVDFFMFPGAIGKRTERPRTAYVFLALHQQTNTMLCVEVLHVKDTLEEMWGRLAGILLAQLASMGMRPAEIHVKNPLLLYLLPHLFEKLGTRVVEKKSLKQMKKAKRHMERFLL
ncbi:MAG: hypothetical protein A4E67_01798 [Syntrophaceae bacterium PtaB.Bin038]|nr:MAG: hypothetical protein A4E67_01798 [Syntrophaceae bacterium PtaB.Bin038]